MPFFTHTETEFHYYDEGRGLPVVFLHGIGAGLRQVVELLEGMPGIRLISLDFRCHGRTIYDGPADAFQIPVFADDVITLLDHLQVDRAVFGGISLGAAVALNAALRYPERVRALILVRPAWLQQPFPINLDLLVRIGRWTEMKGVEGARETLLADDNFREIRSRNAGAADALLGLLRGPQAGKSYEALKRLPASVPFHHWEELEKLDLPALIITNQSDPLHPRNYGRQLGVALRRAELHQVAPRYLAPEQHYKEVRRYIAAFLQRLEED